MTRALNGVRDLTTGSVELKIRSYFAKRPQSSSFDIEHILKDATARAQVPTVDVKHLPDGEWWSRLSRACGEKVCSPYGHTMLREKLVRVLSERLMVNELFRLHGSEIEKESIHEPFLVLGMPRSGGHLATHMLARSGLFLSPRMRDTTFPSLIREEERDSAFRRLAKRHERTQIDFRTVRRLVPDMVDDDTSLHLLTPYSYAWGLLHGLDEYLLNCIQEDQTKVYAFTKQMLQMFQWYRRCGHFSDCVSQEHNQINNAIEIQRNGEKLHLSRQPWILHSPLGILNTAALHTTFPDMNVIWVHRALAKCIPSFCSALAIHNSMYTGKAPSETTLAQIGEKVVGMFGSGTDQTVDYFADFPKQRMVHWANRDLNRHGVRLMMKTMEHFRLEIDRHRKVQGINAFTEFQSMSRPLHDAELRYFALHEGVVGQMFETYIHQFEEFAFEPKHGMLVQNYEQLTAAHEQTLTGKLKSRGEDPGLNEGRGNAGHFLQDGVH